MECGWRLSGDSVEGAPCGTNREDWLLEGLTKANRSKQPGQAGGPENARAASGDHGMTLPDWVVLTVTGCWAGAGTVVTIVTGFGAAWSITFAPGGAVWPG